MQTNIYKITNDINDKVYVGKTNLTPLQRFAQHCADSAKPHSEHRPLYNAMNKYGVEHFTISLIESCPEAEGSAREVYWIDYYEGYTKGYNATIGGDGKNLYDHTYIESLIRQNKTSKEIMELVGCSVDVIRQVAHNTNLILNDNNPFVKNSHAVAQYDRNGNYIQSFDSYGQAAKWLVSQGKGSASTENGMRSHIGDVCKGKRKTAYSYIWKDIS